MRLIDMHCDTIFKLMENKEKELRKNDFSIDVDKLKKADSMVQFFASFVYLKDFMQENRMGESFSYAKEMIGYGKKQIEACNDAISLVFDYEEVIRNEQNGKVSAILTLEEGGVILDKMENLEELYQMGIRLITLTWNYENCIGFPNSREPELMKKGLKLFGIEVVRRMNELGMIIDVSHLSDGGFWDVMKYSKKPVVASHSNARALCNHPRNLTDDMLRALGEQGGVSGINFYPYFLTENGVASVEDIANHVEHMYRVGGEDLVAIGTDFDGFDEGTLDITNIGEIQKVYDAVKRRGFTDRQMEKFWHGNALRVLKAMKGE